MKDRCYQVDQWQEAEDTHQRPYCPEDCTECEPLPSGYYRVKSHLSFAEAKTLARSTPRSRIISCEKCAVYRD